MRFLKNNAGQFFVWMSAGLLSVCIACSPAKTDAGSGVFSLKGQITGLGHDQNPSPGKVYYRDALTGEYRVKAVEVAPGGQFGVSFPLRTPQEVSLNCNSRFYPVYALPGGALTLTLHADRPDSCRYRGDGADVCTELAFYSAFGKKSNSGKYANTRLQAGLLSPAAFKAGCDTVLAARMRAIDSLQAARRFSDATAGLLRDKERLHYGNVLFSFVSDRRMLCRMEPDNPVAQQPLPDDYFDFLEKMPLESKKALSLSQYNELIDAIYFSQQLMDAGNSVKDTFVTVRATFLTYLLDRKVPLTDEERATAEIHQSFLGTHRLTPELSEAFDRQLTASVYQPFEEKYAAWVDSFQVVVQQIIDAGDRLISMEITSCGTEPETLKKRFRACREAFKSLYLRSPSLAADLWTLRFFIENLKSISSRADADVFYQTCVDSVADPAVKAVMKERTYLNFTHAALPATKGGDMVRRLIAAHPGKYVLLDFWGTTCGPCVGDIERFSEMRKSYTGSPDFAYIFVTSSQSSPEADYRNYLSGPLKGEESHRLPADEYVYLEELFDMAGIPRYVLIDREGKVQDDSFDIYRLEAFLKQEKIRKGAAPE